MKIKDILNEYKFETLNYSHVLSDFSCDSSELNDFLKNDALNQQHNKMNLTKLVVYREGIIGYFSLLTDTIKLKHIRDDLTKNHLHCQLPKSKLLPAVKIGKFAIDAKYSGNGIGTHVLNNVLYDLNYYSKMKLGFRFIVVDGYAKAYNFYKRNNFVNLKKDDELIKNLNWIVKRDPKRQFYLYYDLLNFRF